MDKETDDGQWIKDFEKIDSLYQPFYMEDLQSVSLLFLYIDKDSNIYSKIDERFILQRNNFISREEVMGLLKTFSFLHGKKYSLMSILMYNITLDPLLLKKNDTNDFTVIKNIDSIVWKKSISMFHDLNQLIFVFYDKDKEKEEEK